MNNMVLLEAIGGINDSFVAETLNESPHRKKMVSPRLYWTAAAVCLCLIIGTVIYMHMTGEQAALPFSITVYAKDQNDNVMSQLLGKSRVPISIFYSDKGQPVFAFSHPSENMNDEIHEISTTMRYAIQSTQSLYSITGILEEPGNVYYYFFPNPTEKAPYFFTLAMESEKGISDYDATFVISEEAGQYYITLDKLEKVERKIFSFDVPNEDIGELPNWLREWVMPYQAVIDNLNEELGRTLIALPEESFWTFYEHYKDKTPAEFEKDARSDLNWLDENGESWWK